MNKNIKKSIVLVISLVLCLGSVFAFSSCSLLSPYSISEAEINSDGELVVTYNNGMKQNLGRVSQNSTNLTVEGESSTVAAAASKGLVSTVSITSNFTKTVNTSFFPGYGESTTQEYLSRGSGVIYKLDRNSGSAFIITNYHVVYDSQSDSPDGISENIEVFLYGREYDSLAIPARYVGGSLYYDIALLYVENCAELQNSVYNEVDVFDSEDVAVGSSAIAIGNPEGNGISASFGVVSVNSEYITMRGADDQTTVTFRVMRIDTAVNSGNSGGGLFNDSGELIGIVNAKTVNSSVENIAYAIPTSIATAVADNIIDNCFSSDNKTVMRPMLGITLGVSSSTAAVDIETGMVKILETVIVSEVSSDGAVYGILNKGDVIEAITVDGEYFEVERKHNLLDAMLHARVGDKVTLSILRGAEEIAIDVVISEDMIIEY